MVLKNQECYDKDGKFLGWFSRSMAVAVFIFAKDKDGQWCILGSERGEEAADYQGYWNVVSGYVDFNEKIKGGTAIREAREELGVQLKESDLEFVGYNDDPSENKQNVTFRFAAFMTDKKTDEFKFSHAGNEGKEVGLIKFIKIQDIKHYKWAFGHDKLIEQIFKEHRPR